MIPSGDLKIITLIRNALSVLIPVLGVTWLWATKQEHWLKDYMEPTAMVVGTLIIFCQFLITRWSGSQTIEKNKFYNIPNTQQHRDGLAQAKTAIADGRPDEALKILSDIKVESVATAVSLLSGRWTERRRDQIAGVLEQTDRSFQQISRDVMGLISALETEMNTYGAVDKEVRAYLQKRYAERLKQKVTKHPINLRQLPTTEGTSDETAEAFVPISADAVKAHISQVFQAAYGRLLITGKPGAGKTVLLLQLELALLDSETDQLPVILNLATWKKDYITLEPWLKEILPAELGVNKKYAADLLQQNHLILLLDGLDEVEEADQVACLEAIGRYRAATDSRYVITSRIDEYSAISKDAPVNLQIEVGDLTLDQMEVELPRMGHAQPGAVPLLNALKKHPALREAAQVPFYFNTLQWLFAGGKTLADLQLHGTTAAEIQAEINPRFVEYELAAITADKKYTAKEAQKYLSFIASNMTKNNKVVFGLVDVQYNWYPFGLSNWQLFVANFIYRLVGGSVYIFFFVIVYGLVNVHFYGLFYGLFHGLFFVISYGLSGYTTGHFNFSSGKTFQVWQTWKVYIPSLAEMSSIVLSGNLYYEKLPVILTIDSIKWSWPLYFQFVKKKFYIRLAYGLTVGLVGVLVGVLGYFHVYIFFFVIVYGLVLGLVLGLRDYLASDSKAIIQITKPYQRFTASMKMGYFSIVQHGHVMYLLRKKGLLPSKIVPFLNDMVQHKILETDGATWRFRHRILQEHFTKRWKTTE